MIFRISINIICNGFIYSDIFFRKSGINSENKLIFTKEIETRTLFAAEINYQAKGR